MGYAKWYAICEEEGISGADIGIRAGVAARVYTKERVREVQRRLREGEFLREIASDMGMDSRNLARYCRRNGIQLFSKKTLQENYKRRKHTNSGRKKGQDLSARNEKIRNMLLKGIMGTEIAKKLGVSEDVVYYIAATKMSVAENKVLERFKAERQLARKKAATGKSTAEKSTTKKKASTKKKSTAKKKAVSKKKSITKKKAAGRKKTTTSKSPVKKKARGSR